MPTKGEAIERGGAERAALHEVLEGYANALAVEAGRMEYYGLTADETAAKIAEAKAAFEARRAEECKAACGECCACEFWEGDRIDGRIATLPNGTPLCNRQNRLAVALRTVEDAENTVLKTRDLIEKQKDYIKRLELSMEEAKDDLKKMEADLKRGTARVAASKKAVAAIEADMAR